MEILCSATAAGMWRGKVSISQIKFTLGYQNEYHEPH